MYLIIVKTIYFKIKTVLLDKVGYDKSVLDKVVFILQYWTIFKHISYLKRVEY